MMFINDIYQNQNPVPFKRISDTPNPNNGNGKNGDETQHLLHWLVGDRIRLGKEQDELLDGRLTPEMEPDRFTSLFQNAPAGFVLLDGEGWITKANANARRYLAPESSLLKTPFTAHFSLDSREIFQFHLYSLLQGGGRRSCTLESRMNNLTLRLESLLLPNLGRTKEKEILVTITDCTLNRILESALSKKSKQLSAKNRLFDLLFRLSELAQKDSFVSLEDILQQAAGIIASDWPLNSPSSDPVWVRIIHDGAEYRTENAFETTPSIRRKILIDGRVCGSIEMGGNGLSYDVANGNNPFSEEGMRKPFSLITDQIGRLIAQKSARREVKINEDLALNLEDLALNLVEENGFFRGKSPGPDDDLFGKKIVGYLGSPVKVLVSDQQPFNRAFLKMILERFGFDVYEAKTEEDTLSQVELLMPDLVLKDMGVPNMDDSSVIEKMRNLEGAENLVIIGVSSESSFDEEQFFCFQSGCNDFISRPVNVDDLLEKIGIYLHLEWIYFENDEILEAAL